MRRVLAVLTVLGWAAWFGATLALLLLVSHVFAIDRELGRQVGPIVFPVYERWALAAGAMALVSGLGWRSMSARGTRATLSTGVVALLAAVVLLGASATLVTPHMDQLRRAGRMDEFRQMHGVSGLLYTGCATALLTAGVSLALRQAGRDRRD